MDNLYRNEEIILTMKNTGLISLQGNLENFFFEWLGDPEIFRHMGDREIKPYTLQDAKNQSRPCKKIPF